MKFETLAIHAGREPDPATGALREPIHLATTFERGADGSYPHGYFYSRSGNPTREALERFYRTFTRRGLCDTTRENEALVALSCESRGEVDGLVNRAVEAGAAQAMPPLDHGFMYERSFYDPGGHHWAVIWMDPKVAQGEEPVPAVRA